MSRAPTTVHVPPDVAPEPSGPSGRWRRTRTSRRGLSRAGTASLASTAACVLSAATLLAPSAGAAPLRAVQVVTGPVASVGAHTVKDVFAACPAGQVVSSGGYLQPNNTSLNGIVLVDGFDPNANRWFVRVKNDSESTLQIQAQARCQSPGSLRQVSGPVVTVAPHVVSDVFAGCAAGETAVSGGYVQPGNTTLNGIVLVSGFDPNANRWFVRVRNDSGSALQIRAQVACDTLPGSLQINGPVASVPAGGVKDVFATCPAGHPRVGGGYVQPNNVTQNGVVLVSTFDSNARRWFVRVKNAGTASLQIQAQIRCL